MSGKGRGKGGGEKEKVAGKPKGVRKQNKPFTDELYSQLEQVMFENGKHLAKKYQDHGTTQANRTKYWDLVRKRLSVVSEIPLDDNSFPTITQIRKKWNYRITKLKDKSDKPTLLNNN